MWPDSAAVAEELATEAKLSSVLADINSHHYAVASPSNPTPVWLKDQLLNQWSHFHMLMWYKDGRLREYEAWSCDDVDSVHNDYQRHLLYLWAFPEFELNKMSVAPTNFPTRALLTCIQNWSKSPDFSCDDAQEGMVNLRSSAGWSHMGIAGLHRKTNGSRRWSVYGGHYEPLPA